MSETTPDADYEPEQDPDNDAPATQEIVEEDEDRDQAEGDE
jgi:hypothetical protein